MIGPDDLAGDMPQPDVLLDEQLLQGQLALDDVPADYLEVVALFEAARQPGRPDELVGEELLVAAMARAAQLSSAGSLGSPAVTPLALRASDRARPAGLRAAPRHRRSGLLGRAVTAKATAVVGAVVLTVSAAAAATGTLPLPLPGQDARPAE